MMNDSLKPIKSHSIQSLSLIAFYFDIFFLLLQNVLCLLVPFFLLTSYLFHSIVTVILSFHVN